MKKEVFLLTHRVYSNLMFSKLYCFTNDAALFLRVWSTHQSISVESEK